MSDPWPIVCMALGWLAVVVVGFWIHPGLGVVLCGMTLLQIAQE